MNFVDRLLGRIILRYFFMLMTHRKPYVLPGTTEEKYHPFFVYVDEAHRFITDDVEGLLTQARKFGIGVTLAHQYLAQLGKPGEKIYEAVRNSTETKVVFRVKSPRKRRRWRMMYCLSTWNCRCKPASGRRRSALSSAH